METFAYLHLAQDYEEPEYSPFSLPTGLEIPSKQQLLRGGAIAVLSSVSLTGAVVPTSAQVYGTTDAYGTYQAVVLRPDGDRSLQSGGCFIRPNPCSGYRPLYPAVIDPGRPIRPQPVDPGFTPVRPTSSMFLRRGDVGSDVRYVQDLLRSAGYFQSTSTGFYATLTESGVKAFQRDYGLGVDGIVGAQTLAALEGLG